METKTEKMEQMEQLENYEQIETGGYPFLTFKKDELKFLIILDVLKDLFKKGEEMYLVKWQGVKYYLNSSHSHDKVLPSFIGKTLAVKFIDKVSIAGGRTFNEFVYLAPKEVK